MRSPRLRIARRGALQAGGELVAVSWPSTFHAATCSTRVEKRAAVAVGHLRSGRCAPRDAGGAGGEGRVRHGRRGFSSAASSSRFSTSTCARLRRAAFKLETGVLGGGTDKQESVPSSICGRNPSCCALFERGGFSSTNSSVPCPFAWRSFAASEAPFSERPGTHGEDRADPGRNAESDFLREQGGLIVGPGGGGWGGGGAHFASVAGPPGRAPGTRCISTTAG